MQIREIMTRDVEIASPDDTIQKAAQMMKDVDTGMLPVGENDQLVGIITDGISPSAPPPRAREWTVRCAT